MGLVPDGEELAGGQFDGGGVAEIAGAVVGEDDGGGPGATVVGAEAGVVTHGFAAVAIGHDEAAVAETEEMRGQAPDVEGAGDGPGFAAVGGFGLEDLAVVGGVVVADVDDEATVGGFDAVEFVVVLSFVAGAVRNGAEPGPGLAVVRGDADADFAGFAGVAFAGVEEATIGEGDGAVGARDGDAIGGGPGVTAVGRAEHPGADEGLALGGGSAALDGLPAGEAGGIPVFGGGEDGLVGEGGEGGEQEGAGGGFKEAGVAVVDGGIEDDLGPGPGEAVVEGAGDFEAAEGVNVALAAAGAGDDEFAGAAADEGGPGVIVARLLGDDGERGEGGEGREKLATG